MSADRPAVRVGPYVWLDRRGCQIVATAMEYTARAIRARNGGGGIDLDVEWVRQVVTLAARQPPPATRGDTDGSESAPRRFTLTMPSSFPMWTPSEVAELHQVSVQAVRQALRDGRLTGERRRGGWLVREDTARMWQPGRRNAKTADDQRTGRPVRQRRDRERPDPAVAAGLLDAGGQGGRGPRRARDHDVAIADAGVG